MINSKNSFVYTILFMILITAFFTFLLAGLNHMTSDAIALNEETDLRSTILYVFDINPNSNDPKIIEETFDKYVESKQIGDETIYYIEKNGEIIAYAFPVNGVALWGSIQAYASVSADFTELLGIDFISHNETPGLGGRITEEWFKEQFRGLDLTKSDNEEYIKYRPAPNGNVDAITGATITSNAVRDIFNENIHEFINKEGGEM
ncbi:FMN-binding protein [Schnuerera sp. xch1]|uniref:FMN-binding protein n=1 Tax=Schnuerera sp. xch1 TaxID=2874283 RepID=UPI001CBE8DCD|nr:FMN-binding protein [Schnuerera sp. xch1]MBZ2174420.1 FMN-binding protein [Schnuerera sp. xch1]